MFFKSVKMKKTDDEFKTDKNIKIEEKQELIIPFKHYNSKDSKNLFAKKMLVKKKQEKI